MSPVMPCHAGVVAWLGEGEKKQGGGLDGNIGVRTGVSLSL